MAAHAAADDELRLTLGAHRRGIQPQWRVQRPDGRGPVRSIDCAVSAGNAERCSGPADPPAAETVQGRFQQPGAERRHRMEPGQAGRLSGPAARQSGLPRQLRHQLLRRGIDRVRDGGGQRSGSDADARPAAVHTRFVEPADTAAGIHAQPGDLRVPGADVRIDVYPRFHDLQ